MTDTQNILQTIRNLQEDVDQEELTVLISSIYAGVTVMPSEHINRTTILVTPRIYQKLRERIDADSAATRKEGE